ncbi:MAG: glycosyltransferase family 2 protein [Roseimicrobium sp.]
MMAVPPHATCAVTAVVPVHARVEKALKTLQTIHDCNPRPAEVLVHADGGSLDVVSTIRSHWPEVRILESKTLIGPGGGRNRLVHEASHELVANFDDDSFPASPDYFARILALAEHFPDAAAFSAASQESEANTPHFLGISCASGCGCVFRKSWFTRTMGFVPLPIAYNMEEVDVGLQLHALGGVIVLDPQLRVIHDNTADLSVKVHVGATVLANTVLLPALRYPFWLWPLALVHLGSLMWNYFQRGWSACLLPGLRMIPSHILQHWQFRKPVSSWAVFSWLYLRRHPRPLGNVDVAWPPHTSSTSFAR